MTAKYFSSNVLLKTGLLLLTATCIGLFFASQSYLIYIYRDSSASFTRSMSISLPDWYGWALFAPVIVWLAKRFPLARNTWVRSVSIHFGIGIVITFLKLFIVFAITDSVAWLPSRPVSFYEIHPNYVTYWVIVGLSHAIEYYRKYRERELHSSQLETRLARAQLQVLKMQLQPHFLFNTLHAISALMHRDVEAADRMMAHLSDLLRQTLDNVGVQKVTLKEELEFLEGYLEIERTRFQDRLTIDLEVDPETLDIQIPNLILQPLVENAIRHGIEPRASKGRIEIIAKRVNGMLEVTITDDGPGVGNGESAKFTEGVGLQNTRARLQQLYGDNFRFDLGNSSSGGFVVNLAIPVQFEPSLAHEQD